jgi:Domain of unknown function (DUF4388)
MLVTGSLAPSVGVLVLQGTFETLSLPEVLGLLASARKSGALWLDAGPISGVAHLADGHCHAAVAGDQLGPAENGTALLSRLVDLCFGVMCQESGSFRFAADDPAPWVCAEQVELSDVLVEVDRLLKQWREILRVIPSLECRPQLLDALEVDELVIDRERWALLVAMDGRRTVRELVQRTNRPVIELCQALLELVDAGAVGVIDPAAGRAPEAEPTEPEVARAETPAPENVAPENVAAQSGAVETGSAEAAVVETMAIDAAVADAVAAGSRAPSEPAAAPQVTHAEAAIEPTELAPAVVLTIVPQAEVEGRAEPEVNGAPDPQPSAVQPPAAAEPAPSGTEAPDKGAFLRLFSGLRDS